MAKRKYYVFQNMGRREFPMWLFTSLVVISTLVFFFGISFAIALEYNIFMRLLTGAVSLILPPWFIVVFTRTLLPDYESKYPIRNEGADRFIHIEKLSDGDMMDELDRRGALFFYHEADAEFLEYLYNLFEDKKLLKSKELTFYEITKADLYSHFTYFESDYKAPKVMYVLPYDMLRTEDRDGFRKVRSKYVTLFVFFVDYTDVLDGIVTKPYGYCEYRYKGIRNNVTEQTGRIRPRL